ncbi:MAG: FlaD/FlaE family flagellar protein, partial [Halobacteriota archaeon]
MSESPWGNEKEKPKISPFGTGAIAGAVFPENATVTPIGEQSNHNNINVADSNIHVNPVGQQDPKQEVPIINVIDDLNPSLSNSESFFPSNEDMKNKEQGQVSELQDGNDLTTNGNGLRKKPLPLFEPELPIEDEHENTSFLSYAENFKPDDKTDQPAQRPGIDHFKDMPETPSTSPFTQPEELGQKPYSKERKQEPGTPLFPPSTPDMRSKGEDRLQEENNTSRSEGSANNLLTLIKNTFKRFTQKKKLIDRMEEWQPPEPEERAEQRTEVTTVNTINRDIDATTKTNIPTNYENAENVELEEIRKVIPIEPQNNEDESVQKKQELKAEQSSPDIASGFEETEETDNTVEFTEDPNISYSSEDIQKIKEKLADSKKGNEELGKDVKELTGTITELESSVESIKKDEDSFNSIINMRVDESTKKIESLEERLNEFEVTLESIHTDNAELKTGLNTIEQNITELTGSYGIMLKQMQKLTEFSNSRSAEIFETNKRIDRLDQTLSTLNIIQEESQKRMLELRSVTSDLIRGVEKTHNANKELRNDSEEQDRLLRDELESLTDFVEKEFKNLGARSYRANGENIQLNNISKNSTNMKLCMEWLEFLMELVGRNHLADILSYYEELGWISEDVRVQLMRYADGIDYYIEKTDWKLAPDDHVKSIWFIEQLAGLKVDKNRLSIVEKNIKK